MYKRQEFDLLSLLVQNGGNIVTKNDILNKVWGYEKNVSTNVVEVYIRYLRNKLAGINIETIRGIGSVSYTHLDVYKRQTFTTRPSIFVKNNSFA